MAELTCQGWPDDPDCTHGVTHIDDKGYVYCPACGKHRKEYRRCRKLTRAELAQLQRDEPIWYDPKRNRTARAK